MWRRIVSRNRFLFSPGYLEYWTGKACYPWLPEHYTKEIREVQRAGDTGKPFIWNMVWQTPHAGFPKAHAESPHANRVRVLWFEGLPSDTPALPESDIARNGNRRIEPESPTNC